MVEKQIMEEKLNLVSDKMMILKNNGMKEKYPVSLIDINCWEWPQGVGLCGLYRYYEMSRKPELLTFLTDWYDRRMEEGIVEKNVNSTSPIDVYKRQVAALASLPVVVIPYFVFMRRLERE